MSANTAALESQPSEPTTKQLRSHLQCHVNGCLSPYPSLASLTSIRKLGMNGHFTEDIIASGIVPRLIELLDGNHSVEIQYEATWILTNIVAGTTLQTRTIMQLEGHKKLIQLIDHHSLNIRHTAIEALGNIAGDCSEFRDQLLDSDLLSHLLPFCSPIHSLKILRSVTWTLGGLCRTNPAPKREHIDLILKGLSTLLFCDDDEILTNVCWAYCHLLRADDVGLDAVLNGSESTENIISKYTAKSNDEREQFQTVMVRYCREINSKLVQPPTTNPDLKSQSTTNRTTLYVPTDVVGECYKMYAQFSESTVHCLHNDVLRRMIALLEHPTSTVLHSAIVSFGNMQRYMTEERVVALHRDHGIMHKLHRLLDSKEVNVRRDCCWVISNIIVTLGAQSEIVIDSKVLLKVITMVREDRYEVAMEAMWAMANAVEKYYELVVRHGIIEALFTFMATTRDKETFVFTMDVLASIIYVTVGEYTVAKEIGARIAGVNAISCIMDWTERHSSSVDTALQERIDIMLNRLHRYLAAFDERIQPQL